MIIKINVTVECGGYDSIAVLVRIQCFYWLNVILANASFKLQVSFFYSISGIS